MHLGPVPSDYTKPFKGFQRRWRTGALDIRKVKHCRRSESVRDTVIHPVVEHPAAHQESSPTKPKAGLMRRIKDKLFGGKR